HTTHGHNVTIYWLHPGKLVCKESGCLVMKIPAGGTIRTCQKFLVQYNRKQLLLLLHNCTSEEERQSIQKSALSCCLKEVEEELEGYKKGRN
uniref:Uncharacterized protein n=1 Tax=Chelydra serpentina TaxID=8475 RepID=A0A8C3XMX7_CHESE